VDAAQWATLAKPKESVPDGTTITIGFDGSLSGDHTGIIGTVVATKKVAGLEGARLLVVQPLDHHKKPSGPPEVAVDRVSASPKSLVYLVGSREAALASVGRRKSEREKRDRREKNLHGPIPLIRLTRPGNDTGADQETRVD
jgi:ethanolamine utilization protein EutN